MYKSDIKKRIKALGILILILGMITTCFNVIERNNTSHNALYNEDIDDRSEIFDIDFDYLKTATYSSNYSDTGGDLNITLHQSIINEGIPLFQIDNASDPNNNTFYIDCPNDSTFNSTRSQIFVENVYAPNRTLVIELDTSSDEDLSTVSSYAFSFKVLGDGLLQNLSICLTEDHLTQNTDARIDIDLLSAQDSGGTPAPGSYITDIATNYYIDNDTSAVWHNFTNLGINLDASPSNTYDKTFFIEVMHLNPTESHLRIHSISDNPPSEPDDSEVYHRLIAVWYSDSVDISSIIAVSPVGGNTPKPTQIGLKINNTAVGDYPLGSANCTFEKVFSSLPNRLDYELTAEWWDVSCNITKIQVNYTKSDLKASTDFIVLSSGQSIRWNATRLGGISFFDSDFNNYRINFTVPTNWENFQAFNGTKINRTDYITFGSVANGFRELQISNASNGKYWFINATSNNLLQKIHTYVSGFEYETVNYTDTVSFLANFTIPITNGTANLEVFSPSPGYYSNHTADNSSIGTNSKVQLGAWTISDYAEDNYGPYKVQVLWNNGTAAGFLEKDLVIMAITDLVLKNPQIGKDRYPDDIFNITVFYNDTGYNEGDRGIIGANIAVNDTYIAWVDEGNGYYNIEVNSSDYSFGWNYIKIDASDTYYNINSTTFSFHYRLNTSISPLESKDFGDIIRGTLIQYEFNYSDILGIPIEGATLDIVQADPLFSPMISENALESGNYTIELDTSNVQASSTPYICIFNITAIGKEPKNITVTLTIILAQTDIEIIDYNNYLIKKDGLNQTVLFYFNDTDNNKAITGLPFNNVTVTDNQTGIPRPFSLFPNGTDGYYELNITVADLESGWIQLIINITFEPNYNTSLEPINFYLRGNISQIHIISIRDIGGEGVLTGIDDNYSCFIGLDLNIDFYINDTDNNNNLVTGDADSYVIEYYEIGNPTNQGSIGNDLDFNAISSSYRGDIYTSNLPGLGSYTISVKVRMADFEETVYNFNLTLKAKYLVDISVVYQPTEITAGKSFKIILKASYNNGTDWVIFTQSNGANIRIIPNFDGVNATATAFDLTNDTGEVEFIIRTDDTIKSMTLFAELEAAFDHLGDIIIIPSITVKSPPTGLEFEDLMPYIIMIGAVVGVAAASIAVYRGVIVPKKREKQRILTQVKTVFDDAVNLEHILVLYKGTGTCIFFKSFGSEEIDPELISGFISAICSFGKDLVCQEELNEISYGDKMLLLSDGEFIRVALVLSKKASIMLRKNLKEFINAFERDYADALPNWRGQLNVFRSAGLIIDERLSTSIILPHEITYEFSNVKALKDPHSKEVLKVANKMMKDSERNFFFIATLLKEATEKTNKDTAEIFMGIKELRDKKILMPIEISTIEAPPISQQELNLINQRVSGLVQLSPEEKQKLVNDLAQLGPAEREAYFVSLEEKHEIISAPIEEEPGVALIDNLKAAKKEIKNLKKIASAAKKEKDFDKSIKVCQNAAKIATNWELSREFEEIDDIIRVTKIEDLRIKMKNLEKEAKVAAKGENYNEAAQKYKVASKIASEIFKLGVTEMTKEVKRLSNKSKEYEKLI